MPRYLQLMGQLSTFSLAGHETSAAAIDWILYYLYLHTDVQAKLRKEVLAMKADLGSRGDTALTPDDLSNMPYLEAVVVSLAFSVALGRLAKVISCSCPARNSSLCSTCIPDEQRTEYRRFHSSK